MPDGHRRPPFGCVLAATDDGALVGVGDLPAAATGPAVRARRCHGIGARLLPDYRDRLTRDAPAARRPLRQRAAGRVAPTSLAVSWRRAWRGSVPKKVHPSPRAR